MTSAESADRLSVGLDVGGTKVLGVLVDVEGHVLHSVRLPTRKGCHGVVESAAGAVERLLEGAGIPLAALTLVGMGVPGVVDPLTGEVEQAVNLGIDGSIALGSLLSARLAGVPVRADNDLNAAALGAAHLLGAQDAAGLGVTDLAFLALGTGVAAGLVLDGVVRRGHRGAAGEIGHIPFVAGGLACPCGQRGCLEQYASGAALDLLWPSRTGRPAPAELFEAAAAGDVKAVRIRAAFADAVAAAVRILVLTCDVERVVIGGGVSALGAPLLQAVRGTLTDQAAGSPFLRSMNLAGRVELAAAGVPVAAIGASLLGARGLPGRTAPRGQSKVLG
ncbi:MAG TPA: ROK family protein [Dermatophilaceae bacterium]